MAGLGQKLDASKPYYQFIQQTNDETERILQAGQLHAGDPYKQIAQDNNYVYMNLRMCERGYDTGIP